MVWHVRGGGNRNHSKDLRMEKSHSTATYLVELAEEGDEGAIVFVVYHIWALRQCGPVRQCFKELINYWPA